MKKSLLFLIISLVSLSLNAQNYDDLSLPSSLRGTTKASSSQSSTEKGINFFAGGYVNYNLNQSLSLTPYVGIWACDWFRIGLGPRYELTWDYYSNSAAHSFGATAFMQAVIAQYLVLHAGYEYLSYPSYVQLASGAYEYEGRANVHALALGIGFKTYLSNSVSMNAMYLLYPYTTENTLYNHRFLDMFIRFGVDVDLFAPKKQ